MKRLILLIALFFAIGMVLVACGSDGENEQVEVSGNEAEENSTEEEANDEENEVVENNDNGSEEEEVEDEADENEPVADDDFEHEVGDTVSNEVGEMTLIARNSDVGTHEDGPMVVEFEQVNTVSGQIEGDLADFLDTDELEYIQIDVVVENTSDDTINHYVDQATITTNTGEQLDYPEMLLSDHLGGDYIGNVTKRGSLFYVLENSTAEEIESIRIIIDSPHDEDFENVGEGIDIEVEF